MYVAGLSQAGRQGPQCKAGRPEPFAACVHKGLKGLSITGSLTAFTGISVKPESVVYKILFCIWHSWIFLTKYGLKKWEKVTFL